jgi:hypothetical protein
MPSGLTLFSLATGIDGERTSGARLEATSVLMAGASWTERSNVRPQSPTSPYGHRRPLRAESAPHQCSALHANIPGLMIVDVDPKLN